MARDGLSPILCAGVLFGAFVPFATAGEDRLTTALEVQTALQQGRLHMRQGNDEAAVRVLESQIARIDGSGEYLRALRDAYRGHIKNLQVAGSAAEAEIYSRRLRILEGPLDPGSKPAVKPASTPAPTASAALVPAGSGTHRPEPRKVRAKSDQVPPRELLPVARTPDPFQASNHRRLAEARTLVGQAEEEFRAAHYAKAGELYGQAYQVVPDVLAEASERWAYCRLFQVVERLKAKDRPTSPADLDALEKEIRSAMSMTSKLKGFGEKLLVVVQDRRRGSPSRAVVQTASVETPGQPAPPGEIPTVEVKHSRTTGWAVAESVNFRIFHNQDAQYAERVARIAETTRVAMSRKWFGQLGEDWNKRCDVYLHADGQAYSQATKESPQTPGHTTITRVGSNIQRRRIDLHVDEVNLLTAVLPHETTHAVLAGRFGGFDLPRWADEAMAVLSEPPDRVARYMRSLPQYRRSGQFFAVHHLMRFDRDWPEAQFISAFYAQSVSLVDFLCRQKGPQVFTQFMRDGLTTGYGGALQKHYGIKDVQDLETRWLAQALGGENGYAQR